MPSDDPVLNALTAPKLVRMLAAAVVGLGLGTLLPPDPVAVPGVGSVPAVVVAGLGLAGGTALYQFAPRHVGAGGCGCVGDCDCT